jgi:hypothetical protein
MSIHAPLRSRLTLYKLHALRLSESIPDELYLSIGGQHYDGGYIDPRTLPRRGGYWTIRYGETRFSRDNVIFDDEVRRSATVTVGLLEDDSPATPFDQNDLLGRFEIYLTPGIVNGIPMMGYAARGIRTCTYLGFERDDPTRLLSPNLMVFECTGDDGRYRLYIEPATFGGRAFAMDPLTVATPPSNSTSATVDGPLEDRSLAYFSIGFPDSRRLFVIRLSRPELVEHARRIVRGEETQEIHVSGLVSSGQALYNPGWRFRLSPRTIGFFENAIEVCDASPEMVEERIDAVGTDFLPGRRWCPWSSRVLAELTLTEVERLMHG